MPTILSVSPGRVFRYEEVATPLNIVIEGLNGKVRNLCMTQLEINGQANVPFTQAFKRLTYFYTLGERVGDLQVSGIIFPGACTTADDKSIPLNSKSKSGLENLLRYYETYGLSYSGKAIAVAVGGLVLEGFLTGWRGTLSDPATGVGAFSLLMKHAPES